MFYRINKFCINFQALELNPDDKNGLVARSKCFLHLGDPRQALKDAETAIQCDKNFVRGNTNDCSTL